MTRQNERKMKLYMEAGLAVLLVLTIALASAAGLLSPQAGERDKNKKETAAVQEKSQDQKKNDSDSIESQETIADGQYPIMGDSRITVSEMVDYFQASGKPYPKEALSKGGAESIEEFCQMYYDEASAEGVRPEVAFVQTMKETGFLQYGGDASIEQFNFAGLGTTGGGVPGNSYPDVQTGIRAQIQHLKAYATAEPLNGECVDDRYEYVKKALPPMWSGWVRRKIPKDLAGLQEKTMGMILSG